MTDADARRGREKSRQVRGQAKLQRQKRVKEYNQQGLSVSEIAAKEGKEPQTIRRDLKDIFNRNKSFRTQKI